MYTVREVAHLTGVGESTLRVWERRYRVVTPSRSAAGYRLYSDADVDLLRRMTALVEAGARPARAAELVRTLCPAAPPGDDPAPGARLVDLARALDAEALAAHLDELAATSGFDYVADEWLLPGLDALGCSWADGVLQVAHEHFATAVLQGWLAARHDALPVPLGPTVLLGLPPGNRHSLGLQCFAVAARSRGLRTVQLGADVPVDSWVVAARESRARAVVLAASRPADVRGAHRVVQALAALDPELPVLAGGRLGHRVSGARALPHSVASAADQLHLELGSAVLPWAR